MKDCEHSLNGTATGFHMERTVTGKMIDTFEPNTLPIDPGETATSGGDNVTSHVTEMTGSVAFDDKPEGNRCSNHENNDYATATATAADRASTDSSDALSLCAKLVTASEMASLDEIPAATPPHGTAPDGGWGWVIVLASLMTHMLTVGALFSLSVLYVDWLEEFGAGRSGTSWVISVAIAVTYGIGPIPAHLASRFGYKIVAVIGGIISSSGFLLASFANNVYMLILSIGLVAGIGSGFCYLPAVATVALYFDKKRSLAIGMGTSGVGIGSFIWAPIYHWLVGQFGWRGTLLVLSGIVLNLCVLGLLIRPLRVDSGKTKDRGDRKNQSTDTERSRVTLLSGQEKECLPEVNAADSPRAQLVDQRLLVLKQDNTNLRVGGSVQQLSPTQNWSVSRFFSSVHELRRGPGSIESGSKKSIGSLVVKHGMNLDIAMCGSIHSLSMIQNRVLHYESSQQSLQSANRLRQNGAHSKQELYRRNNILLPSLPQNGPSANGYFDKSEHVSLCTDTESYVCSINDITQNPMSPSNEQSSPSLCTSFLILKNRVFLIFVISNIFTNLSFLMPVLFMVDRARDSGIDQGSAAMLVAINGIGNVCGRFILGFITDWLFSDRLVSYIFCLGICGLATCLSIFCGGSMVLQSIYSLTFGSTMGAYVTLVTVVTVDLAGVEMVGHAYGVMLLFMGLSGLVGPPLAGWIFDVTGDYVTSFVLHGLFICASALILVPVAINRRIQARKCSNSITEINVT